MTEEMINLCERIEYGPEIEPILENKKEKKKRFKQRQLK